MILHDKAYSKAVGNLMVTNLIYSMAKNWKYLAHLDCSLCVILKRFCLAIFKVNLKDVRNHLQIEIDYEIAKFYYAKIYLEQNTTDESFN